MRGYVIRGCGDARTKDVEDEDCVEFRIKPAVFQGLFTWLLFQLAWLVHLQRPPPELFT